jgi:hypothetical protein
MRKINPFRKTV